LAELIVAGKAIIADKESKPQGNETIVGWRVSDLVGDNSAGVYLLMEAAREVIKKQAGYDLSGFSSRTLHDQLDEMGAIGIHRDPKRKTRQIRINGTRVPVVHITAAALFGEDDLGL